MESSLELDVGELITHSYPKKRMALANEKVGFPGGQTDLSAVSISPSCPRLHFSSKASRQRRQVLCPP